MQDYMIMMKNWRDQTHKPLVLLELTHKVGQEKYSLIGFMFVLMKQSKFSLMGVGRLLDWMFAF